jgi:hypothetical protein
MTKDELIRKLSDLTTHEQIVAFADALYDDNAAQVAAALRDAAEHFNLMQYNLQVLKQISPERKDAAVWNEALKYAENYCRKLIPGPPALDRRKP